MKKPSKCPRPAWDKLRLRDVEKWGQVFAMPPPAVGDIYTFAFPNGSYLSMNSQPFHPQYGIGQHGEGISGEWLDENEGHRIKTQRAWRKLPKGVRECIHREIEALKGGILEQGERVFNEFGDGDGADGYSDGICEPADHDPSNDADRGTTYAWVRGWIRVELY